MFFYSTKIKFHETDAAGRLFFAHQFNFIHDAYEAFMEHIGFSLSEIVQNKPFLLPIVRAQSDYKRPLFVGDTVKIHLQVSQIGQSSFSFQYLLFNKHSQQTGAAQTTHVTIDKLSGKKIPIPDKLRLSLKKYHASFS